MPKVANPLAVLDTEIAIAWDELLEARHDAARSPNADSLRTEQYAEARVNRLLEQRHRMGIAEALVKH